jgi:MgtC family protein
MDRDDLLLRLGMALAIGFLIGLERGWKERGEKEGQRTAGLRTYTLIALLGGIFGALTKDQNVLLLASGFVIVSGALAAFFWREGVLPPRTSSMAGSRASPGPNFGPG